MKCENTYAHIFFDQIPDPTEKKLIQISFLLIHYQINLLSRHCAAGKSSQHSFGGLYGRLHLNLSETSAFQSGKSLLGLGEVSTRSESIPA